MADEPNLLIDTTLVAQSLGIDSIDAQNRQVSFLIP